MLGPLPATSVHLVRLNLPVLFVVNDTVPVGVVGVVDLSITFTVQVVVPFTRTEPGEQLTVVCVGCPVETGVTVTVMLFDAVFAFASVTVTLTISLPAELNDVEKLEVVVAVVVPLTDHANVYGVVPPVAEAE